MTEIETNISIAQTVYEGVAQGNRGRVKLFGNKLTDYKGMYQEVIAYDPWSYEVVSKSTAPSGGCGLFTTPGRGCGLVIVIA